MNIPPRPGETIYKGHRSYNLMRSLQQGISFSVASVDKHVGNRDPAVRSSDFKKEVRSICLVFLKQAVSSCIDASSAV